LTKTDASPLAKSTDAIACSFLTYRFILIFRQWQPSLDDRQIVMEIVSFGEWVQERRNQLRPSRPALARLVGCSPVTIKKIEQRCGVGNGRILL
jgi:hypothetical protein